MTVMFSKHNWIDSVVECLKGDFKNQSEDDAEAYFG